MITMTGVTRDLVETCLESDTYEALDNLEHRLYGLADISGEVVGRNFDTLLSRARNNAIEVARTVDSVFGVSVLTRINEAAEERNLSVKIRKFRDIADLVKNRVQDNLYRCLITGAPVEPSKRED